MFQKKKTKLGPRTHILWENSPQLKLGFPIVPYYSCGVYTLNFSDTEFLSCKWSNFSNIYEKTNEWNKKK